MSCFSIRRMSAFRARITAFFTAFVFLTAALPAYAERLPDFLAKIQPSEIFPGADRYGKPEGKPMVARVYKGDEQLGLVYITTDAVNTRGYSSKPIDTLMALANDGTIAGAKLVDHHEPIMLIGIPQSRVDKFIDKYIGLNFIKNPPTLSVAPGDIISGATVTLMVVNDSIQRSYKVIANQYRLGSDKALQTASASDVREAAPASETRPRRMANSDKQDICLGTNFSNKRPSAICISRSIKSTNCLRKAARPAWPITPNRAILTIPLLICMLPWSASLPSVKACWVRTAGRICKNG
ncbi:FMN-binding protein [Neisseria gonorrhoeae]|nr:FMN-binding protein [Neisseria gonorrhoeae]